MERGFSEVEVEVSGQFDVFGTVLVAGVFDDEFRFAACLAPSCQFDEVAFGGFAGVGEHVGDAARVEPLCGGEFDEAYGFRGGEDDAEVAFVREEAGGVGHEFAVGQAVRMAGDGASRFGREGGACKEGGIADDAVEAAAGSIFLEWQGMEVYALRPGTGGDVVACLGNRAGVYFEGVDLRPGVPLGCHEGDEPGAGADVEDVSGFLTGCPGAQQHAVRAHFHGGAVLAYGELFESEHAGEG